MTNEQKDVRLLMETMGQACPEKPTMPDLKTRILRVRLIAEELLELCDAFGLELTILNGKIHVFGNDVAGESDAIYKSADATTDLKVMVIGTDVAMGIDGEPVWHEVQRANMSKVKGGLDEFGKFRKGPDYVPPQIDRIIEAQRI